MLRSNRALSRHFVKRLTVLQPLATLIIPGILKLVRASWAKGLKRTWHPEAQQYLLNEQRPALLLLWHGRMFATINAFTYIPKPAVLISHSRDGAFVTAIARGIGYQHFVRGSFGRGGSQASRHILDILQHQSVLVTADGPRGPRYWIKPGLVRLAALANVPIIPLSASCHWPLAQLLRSWDHFVAPNAFSPTAIHFGEPLWVNPDDLHSPQAIHDEALRISQAAQAETQLLDKQSNPRLRFQIPAAPYSRLSEVTPQP